VGAGRAERALQREQRQRHRDHAVAAAVIIDAIRSLVVFAPTRGQSEDRRGDGRDATAKTGTLRTAENNRIVNATIARRSVTLARPPRTAKMSSSGSAPAANAVLPMSVWPHSWIH